MFQETETLHRCLNWFVTHEMATLTPDARTLWLVVYASNLERDGHACEAEIRRAFASLGEEGFDRAYDQLRERGLIVRSTYDESLLLEAIEPALMAEGEPWN
jgi:hypothetical protein